MRCLLVLLVAVLAVPAAASADPKQVKPDRAAINALLDEFIPDVVAQKDLKRGWELVAGSERTVSRAQWLQGNTSVQRYPAKGTRFRGWLVNYSYPGDVGFDILLQPTTPKLGAWSFRAEAKKIGGRWKITTWYPVATFAPPDRTQTVLGPNDLGSANSAASGVAAHSRLGAWVLALPLATLLALTALVLGIVGTKWARRRSRVKAIERRLAATR